MPLSLHLLLKPEVCRAGSRKGNGEEQAQVGIYIRTHTRQFSLSLTLLVCVPQKLGILCLETKHRHWPKNQRSWRSSRERGAIAVSTSHRRISYGVHLNGKWTGKAILGNVFQPSQVNTMVIVQKAIITALTNPQYSSNICFSGSPPRNFLVI